MDNFRQKRFEVSNVLIVNVLDWMSPLIQDHDGAETQAVCLRRKMSQVE